MKESTISVIIIAYNEEAYITKTLDALMKQTVKPEEIIVVDNNSKDKTTEIAQGYKGVRIVLETEQGMSYARNRGFNEAKSKVLVKLDADTILDKDFIKTLKQTYTDNPGIVGAIPHVRFDKFSCQLFLSWRRVSFFTDIFLGHKYCPGPSYSLTKEAWKRIRENICNDDKKIHEDVEISLHLDNIGKLVYAKGCNSVTSSRRITGDTFNYFTEQIPRAIKQYWLERGLLKRFRIFWDHRSPYKAGAN